jgi:hypothetical protein
MESEYPELLAELSPYIFYSENWDTLLGKHISLYRYMISGGLSEGSQGSLYDKIQIHKIVTRNIDCYTVTMSDILYEKYYVKDKETRLGVIATYIDNCIIGVKEYLGFMFNISSNTLIPARYLLGDVTSDYVNINKYLTVTMCIKKVGDFAYIEYVSR